MFVLDNKIFKRANQLKKKGAIRMKREILGTFVERALWDFRNWLKAPMKRPGMTFNVLIKEEDGMYVAHCLELDIVATAMEVSNLREDIISLIVAQIDYAFSNSNLDNLFHPAPAEVWRDFFSCKEGMEEKRLLDLSTKKAPSLESVILPSWVIANICQMPSLCHV